MQRKIVSIAIAGFLATGIASAQEISVNANVNANANVVAGKVSVEATTTADLNTRGNATSSTKKNERATTTGTASSSASAQGKRSTTAEAHMSVVAKFVQSLHAVANRDGGIGAQVRAVAQAQNDTATTTATAITNIEARGKLRTFLFGADYKNTGQLRSDLSITENNIAKLKTLVEGATNTVDKADLMAQIKVLEDMQVQLNAYIKAHESSFSLFGWLNK